MPIKPALVILTLLPLGACGMSDSQIIAASEAGADAALANEIETEYKASQDFDQIGQDAVAGVDTSDFGALTQ